MDKPPKICIVQTPYFPDFSGEAVWTRNLITKLDQNDVSIFVLTFSEGDHFIENEKIDGINIVRMHSKSTNLLSLLKFVRKFSILSKKVDIFQINGRSDERTYILILLGKLFRKKVIQKSVLSYYDDALTIKNSRRLKNIMPIGILRYFILSLCDNFITISSLLTERYVKAGISIGKIEQTPIGVNLERFSPVSSKIELTTLRKLLNVETKSKIALFVGEICERKGVDSLINIWEKVILENPRALLIMVGPVIKLNFFNKIMERIKCLGIESTIRFEGEQKDVTNYFKGADTFVFPSRKEGLGHVQIEAMACGTPVVAFDIKGVTEDIVTNNEDGFIIQNRNEDDFAEKVKLLFRDESLRSEMGKRARQKVMKKFSLNVVADRYKELYRNLIEEIGC